MVAENGCIIHLNSWIYGLAGLMLAKTLIQFVRLLSFMRQNQESIWLHIGGNFIVMPLLTFAFFGVNVYLKQIPYPNDSELHRSHYRNVCEDADWFSHSLFVGFNVIYWLTFIPVCYYIVTTFMLL